LTLQELSESKKSGQQKNERQMTLSHSDVTTHWKNEEDVDILTRKNFDVNMRLFKTSPRYRLVIVRCAEYIRECATTERPGYKKPRGFSGANAGIPFRIIALRDGTVMLNPKITEWSIEKKTSQSNCGSLTLDKPISVQRNKEISGTYYDLDGKKKTFQGYLPTVQHEIDHCDGILITDRHSEIED